MVAAGIPSLPSRCAYSSRELPGSLVGKGSDLLRRRRLLHGPISDTGDARRGR